MVRGRESVSYISTTRVLRRTDRHRTRNAGEGRKRGRKHRVNNSRTMEKTRPFLRLSRITHIVQSAFTPPVLEVATWEHVHRFTIKFNQKKKTCTTPCHVERTSVDPGDASTNISGIKCTVQIKTLGILPREAEQGLDGYAVVPSEFKSRPRRSMRPVKSPFARNPPSPSHRSR